MVVLVVVAVVDSVLVEVVVVALVVAVVVLGVVLEVASVAEEVAVVVAVVSPEVVAALVVVEDVVVSAEVADKRHEPTTSLKSFRAPTHKRDPRRCCFGKEGKERKGNVYSFSALYGLISNLLLSFLLGSGFSPTGSLYPIL